MNRTELFIMMFYQSINKDDPPLLSIERIADNLNIGLMYWPHPSTIACKNDKYNVYINEFINSQQQWQEFGHEMCHYFNDRINRKSVNGSFVNYCEAKADYFAYHFCVPTFMLKNIKGVDVYDVMRLFNVEFDFSLRRLEMYYSKVLSKGVL